MRQREEKGRFRQFCDPQDGSDQRRDSSLLFLSVPGSSLLLAQLHGRPHVSKNQACSRSSNRHLNINQSIITSNTLSLFLLCHFHTHTDCVNQGLDQEEAVTSVQNEKGCPTAPGPDRQWRVIFSVVIRWPLSLSAPFTCLCPCLQRF